MSHTNEIIISAVGVITTAAGWMLGGRQASRRSDTGVVSDGAEQLIKTSQGLLDYLTAQREQAENEKSNCQAELQIQKFETEKLKLRVQTQEAEMEKLKLKIQRIKEQ